MTHHTKVASIVTIGILTAAILPHTGYSSQTATTFVGVITSLVWIWG